MSINFQDRVRGVIFGQAVGDALGLGTEFLTKRRVKTWYPTGLTDYAQIVIDSHREKWQPGEWTDDTDQMLCILDSVLENDGIDSFDIAKRFHSWAFSGGRGLGQTVRAVLSHPDFLEDPHGASKSVWDESKGYAAANGAVMRTSALGVYKYDDPDQLRLNAETVCKITHFDPRCVASCIAVTQAISKMIQGEDRIETLLEDVSSVAGQYDERVLECIDMASLVDISSLELDSGGIGYTLKATAAAFWSLKNCSAFDHGIVAVINEGGDADTNGAVAGALLGARFGYSGIPVRLTENLIGHDRLWHRTERLIELIS